MAETFKCPHCGAVYEIRYDKAVSEDNRLAHCEVCGKQMDAGTARTFGTTNSSRCQTARMFERGRALTSTIGVGQLSPRSNPHEASTDIRTRLRTPRTQPLRLRRAFRITDVNSLLQALEWVAV